MTDVLLKISADNFLAIRCDPGQSGLRADRGSPPPVEASPRCEAGDADPLAGLPLLPEDRRFIQEETRYLAPVLQNDILGWYRRTFLKGMRRETNLIRRSNAGRRRANAFLRRYVRHLMNKVAG